MWLSFIPLGVRYVRMEPVIEVTKKKKLTTFDGAGHGIYAWKGKRRYYGIKDGLGDKYLFTQAELDKAEKRAKKVLKE